MRIVSAIVDRPVEACWRAFTDPRAAIAWVPGLREALVIEDGPHGLPREVQFELTGNLLYSLLYTYDPDAHVVRWQPRAGEQGAVRGFARFAEVEGGTEITYALEHEPGRKAFERAIDNPPQLVESFVRWMHEHA